MILTEVVKAELAAVITMLRVAEASDRPATCRACCRAAAIHFRRLRLELEEILRGDEQSIHRH